MQKYDLEEISFHLFRFAANELTKNSFKAENLDYPFYQLMSLIGLDDPVQLGLRLCFWKTRRYNDSSASQKEINRTVLLLLFLGVGAFNSMEIIWKDHCQLLT